MREARDARGFSQSQLAERIGAHFTSISDWERGKNVPSARHLAGLAESLGESVDFFMAADSADDEEESEAMDPSDALLEIARGLAVVARAFRRDGVAA